MEGKTVMGIADRVHRKKQSFKRLASILTEGDNTLPAGPATNEQRVPLPLPLPPRKKKKKEDTNELGLQILPKSLYDKVRDWYEVIREVKDTFVVYISRELQISS
ncbi:hypothetical protein BT67DRAFT_434319 [Trichocladium antarcticum]|uniref:Uncharacterized protein n=1 Tax=Trichocladium antarcticum TaxID=1450529 RepID=A0AAN6UK23_9PEZI|nr:hypothetical protein BT67DRAFT_434319 [Trichocladium antarcticum]